MCNAFYLQYSCGHVITDWLYCQHAPYDRATNTTSPCDYPFFASTNTLRLGKCPHNWCHWTAQAWRCCQCQSGPNTQASCAAYVRTQVDQTPVVCMHLKCGMCESMNGEISPLPAKPVWLWCMLTAMDGGDDPT